VRTDALALVDARTTSLAATGHACETFVLEGDTAGAILAAAVAHRADIIVCGSHGKQGVRRSLLGGVVQAIVARSTLPVLVIREFETTPPAPEGLRAPENSASIPSRVRAR
jgi:nucleotide-binding universal stress UspA family protein